MVDRNRIYEVSEKIAREFRPDRIILFGSHAYGDPTPDSDVDLMVILRFKGRAVDKAVEIRLRVMPPFPVDFIVRTPENVRERLEMGDDFMREIMTKGEILYEAHDGRVGKQS